MTTSSYSNPSLSSNTFTLFVFEGSDWCVNCRRLEKNVLSDTTFISFLNEKQITLTRVDFPQRTKQNSQVKKNNELLAERYNFDGIFPTLILSRNDTLLYRKLFYNKKQDSKGMQDLILTHLKALK
ncbi:thioredoxin family protein [Hyunsoonleella rubra]|uniref:Thioredoxin family protein n=1 Tax=Hyunsoonleella rubra TaxID=1737062 RepID=A0ABW5TDY9_9FLAO